jgi:predicted ATP-grasp superfamily ATP-dependent carboligase
MVPAVLLGDLNMVRCFAQSGVPILVASSDAREPTLRSRHARQRALIASFENAERAVEDLEKIGRAFPARPSLFYGTDLQLLAIARHRDRLEQLFRLRLPSTELIESLVDKSRFATLASELSLPVPPTLTSREVAFARQIAERIPGPWVIKPNHHDGWFTQRMLRKKGPSKALRADTMTELYELLWQVRTHTRDFVVQSFIPGGEDQIYSFHAYMDERANVLGQFVGKKIRTFPREAGISTYLELVKEPEVVELGNQIVAKLGLIGPVKIDLKRDPRSGQYYVLELNARFNLWHYLGSACGVNLALIAHADLTGQPLPPAGDYRTGVRWLSFGADLRSFLRSYRPSGEIGLGGWLSSLRGPKVYDVFAWDDPLPFAFGALNYCAAVGKRLLGAR